MRVRREVLGDAHVDHAVANTTEFTADFQDFITRYAWGDLWARPGLTRQQRSMVTLALLAGLGRHEEVAMHVRAALRNGLTPAEISEVLLTWRCTPASRPPTERSSSPTIRSRNLRSSHGCSLCGEPG